MSIKKLFTIAYLGLLYFILSISSTSAQNIFKLKESREKVICKINISSGIRVFVFLNPECPLCQKYPNTLNKLYHAYGDSSEWIVIVPGDIYKAKEVNDFCSVYGLDLPVFIDKKYKLTKWLNAKITPQVIILKDSKVQYSGKIDDWPIELGKMRPVVRRKYLQEALNAIFAGFSPELNYTEPIGCFIF